MKRLDDVEAGPMRRVLRDGQYVTHVPFQFGKRSGKKTVLLPQTMEEEPESPRVDQPLLLALGWAFYWQKLLDDGEYENSDALARGIGQERVLVRQNLRLTLLAPDIVRAIMDGRQPRTMSVRTVRRFIPVDWEEQRHLWGFTA